MQYFASSIINKKVLSFHSGYTNGEVIGFLVNKDNLKIELLEIKADKNLPTSYLLTKDIRSLNERLVIIDSEDDLAESDDLIRQKELIKTKFNLLGSKVVTQDGKYLGKVKDFTIDYHSFATRKLYLKAGIMKRFLNDSFIIDHKQILDVKGNKIIVKNSAIKNKQKSINTLQAKAT